MTKPKRPERERRTGGSRRVHGARTAQNESDTVLGVTPNVRHHYLMSDGMEAAEIKV
jgi:hypothetical protein